MFLERQRTSTYKPGLWWFSLFAFVWTVFLLYAGGFTTSIEAGMAFLDWPLSNGSINPLGWTKDRMMRAEHSHRLLGIKLGLLTITLFVWIMLREERRWLRRLAGLALAVVVGQGLLGGMRVLFDRINLGTESNVIAQIFAVLHACGAQIVLCLLVTATVASSRYWIEDKAGLTAPVGRTVRAWGLATCALLFLQILLGAVMRHSDAGLAIYTFPYATPTGDWLPQFWNWAVLLNFSHRLGAVVVSITLLIFLAQIWVTLHTRKAFATLTSIPMILLAGEIVLGALAIGSRLNEYATTLHMLVGAFLLASCWMLTFLSFRFPLNTPKT